MPLPAGLRALEHRDFRVYYAGNLVALVGTWMQNVAQAWLVLEITGSPLRLGLISTLQFGPLLLFALVTGAVADRLPKRRLLVATQLVQGSLALAVAILVTYGHVRYWHVAVMAVLWGLAGAFDQPTRQSFIVEMVGRRDVVSAVGLGSAAFNGARIVGPAVAGLLIGRFGVAPAFALNALAFGVSTGTLRAVRARGLPTARTDERGMAQDIAEGVRYALGSARMRMFLALLLVTSFCIFNFSVYVPLLARQVLGLGSAGFGFLMTALGVGAVLAGLALGTFGSRQPPLTVMVTALAVALAGLAGLSVATTFWAAAALLAVIGFCGITVIGSTNTALQLLAPDALRGRVMSLYTLLTGGIFPLGAFCVGAIAETHGVAVAFRVNGALGLLAVAGLALWWRARGRAGASGTGA